MLKNLNNHQREKLATIRVNFDTAASVALVLVSLTLVDFGNLRVKLLKRRITHPKSSEQMKDVARVTLGRFLENPNTEIKDLKKFASDSAECCKDDPILLHKAKATLKNIALKSLRKEVGFNQSKFEVIEPENLAKAIRSHVDQLYDQEWSYQMSNDARLKKRDLVLKGLPMFQRCLDILNGLPDVMEHIN